MYSPHYTKTCGFLQTKYIAQEGWSVNARLYIAAFPHILELKVFIDLGT